MWCWRRMFRISWTKFRTNKFVYSKNSALKFVYWRWYKVAYSSSSARLLAWERLNWLICLMRQSGNWQAKDHAVALAIDWLSQGRCWWSLAWVQQNFIKQGVVAYSRQDYNIYLRQWSFAYNIYLKQWRCLSAASSFIKTLLSVCLSLKGAALLISQ